MPPPIPRLFAGRAPVDDGFSSSSSEEEPKEVENRRTNGLGNRKQGVRRRKFVAKVIGEDGGVDAAVEEGKNNLGSKEEGKDKEGGEKEINYEEEKENELEMRNLEGSGGRVIVMEEEEEDADEEESSEEEDELEEEEDKEEEDEDGGLPRPVFISKEQRGVVEDAVNQGIDEERAEKRDAERREEARRLVEEALLEEERNEQARIGRQDAGLPDDEDKDEEQEREFALWRVREMKRIMRDRNDIEEWKRKRGGGSRGEGEKVGGKSEEDGKDDKEEMEEKNMPIVGQKSYKMGPFFLEKDEKGRYTEEIYNREYSQGMGEDGEKRNDMSMPLQVRMREVERKERARHTSVGREDTAAGLAGELRRDRELGVALEQGRKRGRG